MRKTRPAPAAGSHVRQSAHNFEFRSDARSGARSDARSDARSGAHISIRSGVRSDGRGFVGVLKRRGQASFLNKTAVADRGGFERPSVARVRSGGLGGLNAREGFADSRRRARPGEVAGRRESRGWCAQPCPVRLRWRQLCCRRPARAGRRQPARRASACRFA